MPSPQHRLSAPRLPLAHAAVVGALTLTCFAALAPAASADGGPNDTLVAGRPGLPPVPHGRPGSQGTTWAQPRPGSKPASAPASKPTTQPTAKPTTRPTVQPEPEGKQDTKTEAHTDDQQVSGPSTNGGHLLGIDAGLTFKDLGPTPPPVTPYELPFPCGETWTGDSRPGHSPSPRAVDFNFGGNDLGKPVVAAASGTVVTAVVGRRKPSYGQYVVIDHGNGESTLYGHLDSVLVAVGQPVAAGTQIGTVGDTGNSFGSHLHFEERVGNAVVDSWFHGVPLVLGTPTGSQNCGGAPVPPPVTTTVTPPVVVTTSDVPMAGNMYGGRAAEVMVYRRVDPVAFHVTRHGVAERTIRIGATGDQPVLGDWDGNGRVNPGVRAPRSHTFELRVRGRDVTVRFGRRADLPVAGNWDGVGGWEVGVYRQKSARFLLLNADGSRTKVPLGDADDRPVVGDWDGDHVTDLGVYDVATATFTLLGKDAKGAPLVYQVPFGTPGDLPVTGDWDGNGVTDLGTWNPTTETFAKRGAEAPAAPQRRIRTFVYDRIGSLRQAPSVERRVSDGRRAAREVLDAFRRLAQ